MLNFNIICQIANIYICMAQVFGPKMAAARLGRGADGLEGGRTLRSTAAVAPGGARPPES